MLLNPVFHFLKGAYSNWSKSDLSHLGKCMHPLISNSTVTLSALDVIFDLGFPRLLFGSLSHFCFM